MDIIRNRKNVIFKRWTMHTLIKQIRTYLNMSQTEFADRLNVTFQTVNRWENGRAVPNKLAQSMIYEF